MFKTQNAWREKCEGLEARVSELESDATARDEELVRIQGELVTAQETAASNPTAEQVATLTTQLQEAQAAAAPEKIEAAALALLNDSGNEAVQKVVAARVTEELAKGGHHTVVEDNGGKSTTDTLTRAEFNALSPIKRGQFLKSGGKLTD